MKRYDKLLFLFAAWCGLFLSLQARAQGNLQRQVTLSDIRQQQIGQLLDKIAAQTDFSFAYNNHSIPADSAVSLARYQGTVNTLLSTILGNEYEFKEVPGYIILRHAPGKLDLQADIESNSSRTALVRGQIRDAATGRPLELVSVYEKNLLTSALTDAQGNFELRLKRPGETVLLSASRDRYRDTSLHLLLPVVVSSTERKRRYRYYPADEEDLQSSRLGRFFTSSRQRVQNLNLGKLFAYSPYQLSFVPGLSTHGMYNSQVINRVSLNIIGGYTAGVSGAELAGAFNINRADVDGFQAAGLFNISGRNLNGAQIGGAFNAVAGKINGTQATGLLNRSGSLGTGAQIAGFANITGESKGLQVAAFGNYAAREAGLQLSGFGNRAGSGAGGQLGGLVNIARGTSGWQASAFMNIAKKVKGFQFAGLINVADSSDYPVGFVNFIKNGSKSISVGLDEASFFSMAFRSGGRVLYGLLAVGYRPEKPSRYGLEVGFGGHLLKRKHFALDAEISNRTFTDFDQHNASLLSVRALPAIHITRNLRLFAGPSLSLASFDLKDTSRLPGWIIRESSSEENRRGLVAGWSVGLQMAW
ncbi:hypothetical protein C7T94_13540 [Pedobacter yulinensis]|uniref:Carboxypeptidase-like regulatory domain-containing protein n=1 Tax=Pedobacter yulinensis TaxID=2126353 RepID=A0A2T3HMG7_9SPHI|nr:hypothetical protein [Pedobacter yulinensis]PST83561.1 hypothetical protein C7T94_13540 [Pedobacter yulinensis]